MKKTFLLAGFFILTSTSQSFAKPTQQDTLPNPALQHYKLCDKDLKLSFLEWRKLQMQNSSGNEIAIDSRSSLLLSSNYNAPINLNWWPQAVRLNISRSSVFNNSLTGFAGGFSSGLSTTGNYNLNNTSNWEIDKSFYSISSFLVGAGVGALVGLKNPRQLHN